MSKKDILKTYRNYLATLIYNREYGTKYGDTPELIEMYERRLKIKRKRSKNESNEFIKKRNKKTTGR